MGQQMLRVQTNEGRDAKVVYQIAEVSRPLIAVSATCGSGNSVVYTPQGGFIMNCQSGRRTHFERNGGIYELDLWVRNENMQNGHQPAGFPWQGR